MLKLYRVCDQRNFGATRISHVANQLAFRRVLVREHLGDIINCACRDTTLLQRIQSVRCIAFLEFGLE